MTDGYDDEQLKFREKHGWLVWDTIRIGTRQVETRKRDGWQARLAASLTRPQHDAMCDIEAGFMLAVAGLGMRILDPQRLMTPSGRSTRDNGAALVADYFAWGREVMRRKHSHAMAMAIISENKTCAQVDQDYRQIKGRARKNLIAALDVYCDLQGWL